MAATSSRSCSVVASAISNPRAAGVRRKDGSPGASNKKLARQAAPFCLLV
jgi:hypothetical protein